jgi:hypothetical protein
MREAGGVLLGSRTGSFIRPEPLRHGGQAPAPPPLTGEARASVPAWFIAYRRRDEGIPPYGEAPPRGGAARERPPPSVSHTRATSPARGEALNTPPARWCRARASAPFRLAYASHLPRQGGGFKAWYRAGRGRGTKKRKLRGASFLFWFVNLGRGSGMRRRDYVLGHNIFLHRNRHPWGVLTQS